MLDSTLRRYCRLLDVLIGLCLAVMVVLVFANVVLRYAFNSGITVSEELSRWLFVWMTFLGAIVALREGSHLGSDTLVSRLPLRGKKLCMLAGHLLMLGVCGLVFKGTYDQVLINWSATSAAMETSMALFYACGLVFSVSAALVLVHRLVRLARNEMSENELIGVRESEEEPVDVPKPVR